MEQIIKLPVDAGNVVLSEDYKSILKNLFSGCSVNFLLGAGFSGNLLGTLSNNEVIFEAVKKYGSSRKVVGSKSEHLWRKSGVLILII